MLAALDPAVTGPSWDAISGLAVGFIAGGVAVWSARLTDRAQQSDRRRTLYAEAYRGALGWSEMLYRIRRRTDGPEQVAALVEQFHSLQEQITFYQGWITTESPALGRSYERLVRHVKSETEGLIRHAWRCSGRAPDQDAPADEKHPNIRPECSCFLADVRDHLSPWPWSRHRVETRNP